MMLLLHMHQLRQQHRTRLMECLGVMLQTKEDVDLLVEKVLVSQRERRENGLHLLAFAFESRIAKEHEWFVFGQEKECQLLGLIKIQATSAKSMSEWLEERNKWIPVARFHPNLI